MERRFATADLEHTTLYTAVANRRSIYAPYKLDSLRGLGKFAIFVKTWKINH